MANAKCRNCYNNADADGYCSSCASDITAKALNPFFGGKWKKTDRPDAVGTSGPLTQQRQFRFQP